MKKNYFKQETAIVIPCYKVKKHVLKVIKKALIYSNYVIIVDDHSPLGESNYIKKKVKNKKNLKIIKLTKNLGVGGATMEGYKAAVRIKKVKYIFKIDGDDQMNCSFIPQMVNQLSNGFDYVKGNRFGKYSSFSNMPIIRIVGNIFYSLLSKLSTGYYHIGDTHNGFTGIKIQMCKKIINYNISKEYFFEIDMLFYLNKSKAKVKDIFMKAIYKDEVSNVNYFRAIFLFPLYHFKNIMKRLLNV